MILRFCLLAVFTCHLSAAVEKNDVFVSGQDGYHTYRIPALLRLADGTLLAFAEGRKKSISDRGDIDVLLKRSSDEGRTWSPASTIWDDGANTCGNPCPVIDTHTGTIWLFMTHNLGPDSLAAISAGTGKGTRTAWVTHSADGGATWSIPENISPAVKPLDWNWYATGPGIGIQLQHGTHAGRLVIPAVHNFNTPTGRISGSHAIYSDDHGKTWQLGGTIRPQVSECQVVELPGEPHQLLMTMRPAGRKLRAHATSLDGGLTWTNPQEVPELPDPTCQASILAYPSSKSILLFANPSNRVPKERLRFTVKSSEDNGRTWSRALELHPGLSAYSSLVALPNGFAGCLYECGEKSLYERLTFARFEVSAMPPVAN